MFEILRKIRGEEREAMKILEEANIQAEKIKQKAEEKAEKVYEEAYEEVVSEASQKSMKLKERAREDAERESKKFLFHAEKQMKELRAKAGKKIDVAVNAILKEIVS
ncbi:MAG: hypothetical protein JSV75_03660 [Candidatus Bathyarchaeota archaeon]|nr:MAG: hypothetical protein JSV75_03660 [Candidatus Bathyarchaeota archaeon]